MPSNNKITYDNPRVSKRKAVMEYSDTGPIVVEFYNDDGVLAERATDDSRNIERCASWCRDWFNKTSDDTSDDTSLLITTKLM